MNGQNKVSEARRDLLSLKALPVAEIKDLF